MATAEPVAPEVPTYGAVPHGRDDGDDVDSVHLRLPEDGATEDSGPGDEFGVGAMRVQDADQPLLADWSHGKRKKAAASAKGVKPRCMCCFASRSGCLMASALIAAVAVALIIVILRFAVAPAVVRHFMKTSPMVFQSINLTNPSSTTVDMTGLAQFPTAPASVDVAFTSNKINVDFVDPSTGELHRVGNFPVHRAAELKPDGTVLLETTMLVTNVGTFTNMTHALYNSPLLTWHLEGMLDIKVTIAGIRVSLDNIRLEKSIGLTGCNGLPDTVIDGFQVHQEGDKPIVSINVTLNNPSPINIIPIGDVEFLVASVLDGVVAPLGPPAVVKNFALLQGRNTFTAQGVLEPDDLEIANRVFSQYLGGVPTDVIATVPPHGTSQPLYADGLQGLSLETALPGFDQEIILSGTGVENFTLIFELLKETHHVDVPVRLVVVNPLEIDITMFAVEGFVLFNSTEYGLQDVGFAKVAPQQTPNITIDAMSRVYAPEVPIEVLLGDPHVIDDVVMAFLQVHKRNESHVSINTNITIQVGTTSLMPTITYEVFDIPLYVAGKFH